MRPNLGVLRSALSGMLTETGVVGRPTGGWVVVDGIEVQEVVTVYAGPLLLQPRDLDPNAVEVGGGTAYVTKYDVTLPADTDARRDDLVSLTAPDDAALTGVSFRILDAPLDPWQLARYCVAERIT